MKPMALVVAAIALSAHAQPRELPPPPVVSLEEAEGEKVEPARRPLKVDPKLAPQPTTAVKSEPEEKIAPSLPVGVVAVAGLDIVVPTAGVGVTARPRVGVGLRFALNRRPDAGEVSVISPSAAFVFGYAGLEASPRVFGEGRIELVVNRPGGLFQPGFTLYGITGFDAHVSGPGAFDPYVGAGLGWDLNLFKESGATKTHDASWGTWGGGWGGGGALLLPLIVPVVIGLICAGRVEFRYHPFGVRSGPASIDVLVGMGF